VISDRPTYNRIAGQSLERIGALSDGLFAIAMTLIVLEIHVPEPASIHSELDLWRALIGLTPRFITYLMSFLTLGIFWTGQQTQLNFLVRADRDLAWIHFAFLASVSLLPLSTTLLAEFIDLRLALFIYWLNIFILGALLYASWTYASHAGLVKDSAPPNLSQAIKRRIVLAQSLYALGAGLCIVSTYWSIALIVLVQLYYAVAPRIQFPYRSS